MIKEIKFEDNKFILKDGNKIIAKVYYKSDNKTNPYTLEIPNVGSRECEDLNDVIYYIKKYTNIELELLKEDVTQKAFGSMRTFEDVKEFPKETTAFKDVKVGDYVTVYSGKDKVDEGLVTFKYGNKYLNLDNDSNRKYSYGNGYVKEETKESKKGVSLGFGSMGSGTTVWDRNTTINGDYVTVAHISDYGEVKYYSGVFIPDYAKKEIENYASTVKDKMKDSTYKTDIPKTKKEPIKQYEFYKGVSYDYKNPYEYNRAVEELIKDKENFNAEEKAFISYYSGYGGLEKFGATGKGLLYEYFTPKAIVEKMWGLAYKYGFTGGYVLEPSIGVGEFAKFAPDLLKLTGYEINSNSAKICKILYPDATIINEAFETIFIKNRASIKNKLGDVKKYSLVIGNPPYGDFGGLYAGMGEKGYTKAENYIDYFITRGLDLLESNGLLIMIIGAEVATGGKPFLSKGTSTVKKEIMDKSILVDAYRLPNGVFERTDVLTDIIVLRKK